MWNSEHYFILPGCHFVQDLLAMTVSLSDNLFLSGNWNILWFLLAITAFVCGRDKKPFVVRFLNFALLMFFADYIKYVFFTSTSQFLAGEHNIDTLSRFLLHFYPLCPILIGLLIYHYLKKRRDQIVSR